MTPEPRDRVLLVLSDIEMGAGGPTDDCPHAGAVAERLAQYAEADPQRAIDFVLNGDTFDFLKTPVFGGYPKQISEDVALAKLERIAAAHADFFSAIPRAMGRGAAPRRLVFITGNHDLELSFPAIQARIRELCGVPADQVSFPGVAWEVADVHVEHGSQGDTLFRVDPAHLFLEYAGRKILNLPWASVGLLEAAMPYHQRLCALDRIKPKRVLFDVLPEARDLMLAYARRYWGRDFWRGLFVEHDPLKHVSWEIVKEVVHRFLTGDADVSFGDFYERALRHDERHRYYVVGHQHRPRRVTDGDRCLIESACLRHEFRLDPRTGTLSPLEKSFVEITIADGRARGAVVVPFVAPPPPAGYMPDDPRSLLPIIAELQDALAAEAAK